LRSKDYAGGKGEKITLRVSCGTYTKVSETTQQYKWMLSEEEEEEEQFQ